MKKTTEDYLKMIRLLQMRDGKVRSIALAQAFGVSKPTVSNIVKRLVAEGYITVDDEHLIRLTEEGLAIAEEMLERNRVIRDLLIRIGVDEETAEADACGIEHAVSPQSIRAIKTLAGRIPGSEAPQEPPGIGGREKSEK